MRHSAHQLRSPLATIIASLNVLTQKMVALDSERAFKLLVGCNNKAKSLLKLVNRLLELSRIMEGIKTIQRDQEVDLVRLIEKILSSVVFISFLKNVSHMHSGDPALKWVTV